ncbi:hypothetical protein [Pontibacter actiniarum]|uniref:Lipocalin-like domain-containing protein n=1 Tax=Pontibacter actiniarum TaxID=323450 RepID=A0A1X9YR73_9BACT|nr:hypothetical protein [Pontibacter actiniarum]ARS35368.1 hypothetical protein CA264_07900 [Pontibacter actiniarum]
MLQADSASLLAKTWVLRETLRQQEGKLEPVLPVEEMRLAFRADGTYRLSRISQVPNAVNGIASVEEGTWTLEAERGLIGMQTTRVDGRPMPHMMLYRWQVQELTPDQLVLQQSRLQGQYLVLEAAP